jgi:hypothetical protein
MDVINKKEIAVFGIKRCGNHPIIHWLIEQMGKHVVHLNDVTSKSPYDSCEEINVKGLPLYQSRLTRKGIKNLCRQLLRNLDVVEYSKKDKGVNWHAIRFFTPKDCLIISYENTFFNCNAYTEFLKEHDNYAGYSEQSYRTVVLRDAYNLFASLLCAPFVTTKEIVRCIELYKQYAKIFLDIDRQKMLNIICINFNEWFDNPNYRIQLARQFGMDNNGEPFQRVHSIGGGSSFNGMLKDGKAQEMNVLERWKVYRKDPSYRAIFRDTNLAELSDAIFGRIVPESW